MKIYRIVIILSLLLFMAGCKNDTVTDNTDVQIDTNQGYLDDEVPVASGEIFDSVEALAPGTELSKKEFEAGTALSIKLHRKSIDGCIRLSEEICKNCKLEAEYSIIAFSYYIDSKYAAGLTLKDYKSFESFTSSFTASPDVWDNVKAQYDSSIFKQ